MMMMIKKSASRNQRSKGVAKVKHVLQVLLLICICFWLLYQIKCSYYHRSRGGSVEGSKTPVKGEEEDDHDDGRGGLKLGRKDLREKQPEEEDVDEGGGNQGEKEDVVDLDDDEIRRYVERLEEQELLEEQERLEGEKVEGDARDTDDRGEAGGRVQVEGSSNDELDEVDGLRGGYDSEINEGEVERRRSGNRSGGGGLSR